jgi:hypothetical protein
MSYQEWMSLLTPSTIQGSGPGATLNTATTATLSPVTGASADVAQVNVEGAFQGWQVGTRLLWFAQGYLTTTATSTTFTPLIAARIGNTGSTYVTLATAAAITTGTTVLTGLQWVSYGMIRCTNVATSGNTVSTQGRFEILNNATAPTLNTATNGVALCAPMPSASGEAVSAVDTTQVQGISLRGTLAGANATVVCTQWDVISLN